MKKTITILTVLIASVTCFCQDKPKQDTSSYVLIGKLPDFQLLFLAVNSPDDISVNQRKAIAQWMQKIFALPTEKKEDPKKEKPKQ